MISRRYSGKSREMTSRLNLGRMELAGSRSSRKVNDALTRASAEVASRPRSASIPLGTETTWLLSDLPFRTLTAKLPSDWRATRTVGNLGTLPTVAGSGRRATGGD